MAITVNLYNCADDRKKLDKTLTGGTSVAAQLYDASSILQPRIRLAYNSAYTQYNYMYIPDFHRYYFITDITTDTGGALIITGAVDVLNTYKTAIRATNAIAVRLPHLDKPGSWRSSYIPDNRLPMNLGKSIRCIEFEGSDLNMDTAGAGSYNFVLNIAGGGTAGS